MSRPFFAYTCIAVLICVLAGCATSERCGLEGCLDDAKITARVQAALNQHADLGPPDSIRVHTLNRVVYLDGMVSDGLAKRSAFSIAKKVAGAKNVEVVNDIAVSR
jgi:osmotically-inducible protein OsmY